MGIGLEVGDRVLDHLWLGALDEDGEDVVAVAAAVLLADREAVDLDRVGAGGACPGGQNTFSTPEVTSAGQPTLESTSSWPPVLVGPVLPKLSRSPLGSVTARSRSAFEPHSRVTWTSPVPSTTVVVVPSSSGSVVVVSSSSGGAPMQVGESPRSSQTASGSSGSWSSVPSVPTGRSKISPVSMSTSDELLDLVAGADHHDQLGVELVPGVVGVGDHGLVEGVVVADVADVLGLGEGVAAVALDAGDALVVDRARRCRTRGSTGTRWPRRRRSRGW